VRSKTDLEPQTNPAVEQSKNIKWSERPWFMLVLCSHGGAIRCLDSEFHVLIRLLWENQKKV